MGSGEAAPHAVGRPHRWTRTRHSIYRCGRCDAQGRDREGRRVLYVEELPSGPCPGA